MKSVSYQGTTTKVAAFDDWLNPPSAADVAYTNMVFLCGGFMALNTIRNFALPAGVNRKMFGWFDGNTNKEDEEPTRYVTPDSARQVENKKKFDKDIFK